VNVERFTPKVGTDSQGEVWHQIKADPKGEWVRYRDYASAISKETWGVSEKLVDFDAWLSFRPEYREVLEAFRKAFGTDTSA
jgi:hypothetical protein